MAEGYILSKYPSSRKLYRFIWSLTKNLPLKGTEKKRLKQRIKYHKFIAHIYVNMTLQPQEMDKFEKRQGYVSISSRLIEKRFGRKFDVHILKGIIEIKPHDTAHRKSREFRITPLIYDKTGAREYEDTLECLTDLVKGNTVRSAVNLMTGRKKNFRIKSSLTKGKDGVRNTNIPKLIKKSIKSLQPCPFNPKYVADWLACLKSKYEKELKNYDQVKRKKSHTDQELYKAEKDYQKAQGRYLNDSRGIQTILNQNPEKWPVKSKKGDLIYAYEAAYKVQTSGRISEIYGGFQSSSRYLKWLLFRDIQDKKNYDVKNSQAHILLEELKACKIKCRWLESYLRDPDAKKKYATMIGIPVDLWKGCFYSLIMGAEPENKYGTIFESLKKHFGGYMPKASDAHEKFLKIVGKLIRATKKWRNYIYKAKDRRYTYLHKSIRYWKNASGMRFKKYGMIKDDDDREILVDTTKEDKHSGTKRDKKKCKRKLAAFMLQGRESKYIHHLTLACKKREIPVYKNEHDGIITGERIPKRLKKEAGKKAGLKNLELKRKPICDKEERKEIEKGNG